ncbi:invasion associated locus B family protein [Magnetovibrio sp. PR-2]|uniref:invasion associated locus B family protein n=1 Tax=Magnetovibrio sp. PR-2 TaxID=3120356 RepID=UPI002FCE0425
MIRKHIPLTVFCSLCLAPALASAEVLLERGDWQAIQEMENGKPVCVMSASPHTDKGKYKKRGTILAIITHRPSEKRIGEVGFQQGYPLKDGSQASAIIDGKTTFKLFGQGEYAWSYDSAADKAIIKAMRGGNSLVVKGTSSRGTQTTDTYSLKGFTAVNNALNKACGVR